jgi:hypothetical protein
MNLFFGGGSLTGLMKPYFWQKVGIKSLIRNTLKQNILCKNLIQRMVDMEIGLIRFLKCLLTQSTFKL